MDIAQLPVPFNEPLWYLTKDGDDSCLELMNDIIPAIDTETDASGVPLPGPVKKLSSEPEMLNAMFVWRKFIDKSGEKGVNCAVFRNENQKIRSSELIQQADAIADFCWPGERHLHIRQSASSQEQQSGLLLYGRWMAALRENPQRTDCAGTASYPQPGLTVSANHLIPEVLGGRKG